MTKKNNTNKNSRKNITISSILEEEDDDFQYYRDILLYTKLKDEGKIESEFVGNKKGDNKGKEISNDVDDISNTEFKVWYLTKWLLKNNRRLRETTTGSHKSTYTRTHSEIQKTSTFVNRLIELGLVILNRTEPSDRNTDTPTSIYEISLLGMLVASMVEFKTLTKGTGEYKEALKSLLELWINYIPQGNKNWSNYNYYYLEGLVEKSLESHDDFLLSFIEIISERAQTLPFNFGDLRYKINNVIFEKLISDEKFKELYLNWLNEFCNKNLFPTNIRELIKFQFKLDVEAQYERSLSQLLNFSSVYFKISQGGIDPNDENVTFAEAKKRDSSHSFSSEIVFDYSLKNQWEQIRNKNLANCDKITILVNCTKCGSIFPLPIEIWNEIEDLSDHIHRYGTKVEIYDLKNNTNAQHQKLMLSIHKE